MSRGCSIPSISCNESQLCTCTHVEGVLDPGGNLLSHICSKQIESLIAGGTIQGGMIPKVRCALQAVIAGIPRVHIIDARLPHATLLEIFTDSGVGTMITND